MKTREQWLNECKQKLAENIFPLAAVRVHDKIRVSAGWPHSEKNGKVVGQCFSQEASRDGHNEIFISPRVDDGEEAAHILAHEMIHAVLPPKTGHGAKFKSTALMIGLEGKPTSTTAGVSFKRIMGPILKLLGPYPHAKLDISKEVKKQSTRLLKAECHGCGYTIRLTKKWAETGLPVCNMCEVPFTLENEKGEEE